MQLRAAAPDVPIVILSGLQDEMLAVKAVQEGAQDYLVKGRVDGTRSAARSPTRSSASTPSWSSRTRRCTTRSPGCRTARSSSIASSTP